MTFPFNLTNWALVERQIFDLKGAADYLGKSRRWLRENSRLVTHERIGRSFQRHDLDRFLTQHRRQGRKGVYGA